MPTTVCAPAVVLSVDGHTNCLEWFATRGLNIDSFDVEPNAWDCGYYFPEFQQVKESGLPAVIICWV